MLGISPLTQNLVGAALIVLVVILAARWGLRRLGRAMLEDALKNLPRAGPTLFVDSLRKNVFANPLDTMKILWSDARDGYVQKIWQDALRTASRVDEPARAQAPGAPLAELHVHRRHLRDGRAVAVIELPPPQRDSEPYVVGIVVSDDQRLVNDLDAARRSTHFFYLNRDSTQTGRDTDLCGWTADGEHRTYNVGGRRDVDGFVETIEAKLNDLKR